MSAHENPYQSPEQVDEKQIHWAANPPFSKIRLLAAVAIVSALSMPLVLSRESLWFPWTIGCVVLCLASIAIIAAALRETWRGFIKACSLLLPLLLTAAVAPALMVIVLPATFIAGIVFEYLIEPRIGMAQDEHGNAAEWASGSSGCAQHGTHAEALRARLPSNASQAGPLE